MHPINKKYFGNRNVGSASTTTDNGIGGEGLRFFNVDSTGSHYPVGTTITIDAPEIPGGVTALVELTISSGQITAVTVTEKGSGYTSAPGYSIVQPATVAGVVTTNTGGQATLTVSDADDFDAIAVGQAVSGTNVQGGTYVLSKTAPSTVTMTQASSGGAVTSATFTSMGSGFDDDGRPLTTDTGAAGSATNQENAIIINANTGFGNQWGDIIKQVNGFAYKVRTESATLQKCLLVANDTLNEGEAFIKATDANGNTYFVTKLTSRVATLAQWSNNESEWLFEDGGRAKWTFDGSPDNDQVTIENA